MNNEDHKTSAGLILTLENDLDSNTGAKSRQKLIRDYCKTSSEDYSSSNKLKQSLGNKHFSGCFTSANTSRKLFSNNPPSHSLGSSFEAQNILHHNSEKTSTNHSQIDLAAPRLFCVDPSKQHLVERDSLKSTASLSLSLENNFCRSSPWVRQISNSNSVKKVGFSMSSGSGSGRKSTINILGRVSSSSKLLVSSPTATNHNFGSRLDHIKFLNEKRTRVTDYGLAFACFGILVMILETELTMSGIYAKKSLYSITMRVMISVSTVILIGYIFAYASLEVKLTRVSNSIEDWKVAINFQLILRIILEILACSIHPIPFNCHFLWRNKYVPVDLILSPPMFLRLYLLFRSLLLHSFLYQDPSARSICVFNRMKFSVRFVMKVLLSLHPGLVLVTFIVSIWLLVSWMMRACERIHRPELFGDFLNSMWLVAITFLGVGYGDIVPKTNCGRFLSIASGVLGSSATALIVAVFARKLQLTHTEKHVHNFIQDNNTYKHLQDSAANVLRETWLIYKNSKSKKSVNQSKIRQHQRKFLNATYNLRRAKEDRKRVQEESFNLTGLCQAQSIMQCHIEEIQKQQEKLCQKISKFDESIASIRSEIHEMLAAIFKKTEFDNPT